MIGRQISSQVFKDRIQKILYTQEKFNVVELGNSFFILKFTSEQYMNYALSKGPCTIFNHYIALHKWIPSFNPLQQHKIFASIWIQLPNIPIALYNPKMLYAIAQKLGKPVKVDPKTFNL